MTLVDTSSWIHMLRPRGDLQAKARVIALLQQGQACWCPMVVLELWSGAGGSQEKRALRDLQRVLPLLEISEAVWQVAYALTRKARDAGVTAPATDMLIAACARHHGVEIESADADFKRLKEIAM